MIVREFYETRQDGVNLYKTYSDRDMRIEQETGAIYNEAIDVEDTTHTYTETDIPIIHDELTDSQALNIIMGRDMNYGLPDGEDIPEDDRGSGDIPDGRGRTASPGDVSALASWLGRNNG